MAGFINIWKTARSKFEKAIKPASPSKEILDCIKKLDLMDKAVKGLDEAVKKQTPGALNASQGELNKACDASITKIVHLISAEKDKAKKDKYDRAFDLINEAFVKISMDFSNVSLEVMKEKKTTLQDVLGNDIKNFTARLITEKFIHDFAVDKDVPLVGYMLAAGKKESRPDLKNAQDAFKAHIGAYRDVLDDVVKEGKTERLVSDWPKIVGPRVEVAQSHLTQALDAVKEWQTLQEKVFKDIGDTGKGPDSLWEKYTKEHAAPNLAEAVVKLIPPEISRIEKLVTMAKNNRTF